MRRWLIVLCVAALLGGCATYAVVQPGPMAGPEKSYTVELPANWIQLTSATDRVLATRDGFGLQTIMIRRSPQKDAFPKIKKAADAALLPSELAALEIAELKTGGEQMGNMHLVENVPAAVGGKSGFRIHFEFRNQDGLIFDEIICGVLERGYYYIVSFRAPRLYYYRKYLPDFERSLASFKLARVSDRPDAPPDQENFWRARRVCEPQCSR